MGVDQQRCDFLRRRMVALREKNHKSQSEMARLIGCDKSAISRAEKIGGSVRYKTVAGFAQDYCEKLGLTEKETALFFRSERAVLPDTSALLKNVQLIDELSKVYSRVIVPDIVINELDHIKDRKTSGLSTKAWQVLKGIGQHENVLNMMYTGDGKGNNDSRIIEVARCSAETYNCEVDILTDDVGFSARLSGTEDVVHALSLGDYMAERLKFVDMDALKRIDAYYADSYEDIWAGPGIPIPDAEEVNAYLPSGLTLMISVVRNRKVPLRQRKAKIRWLITQGADVDKRDSARYYLPPLSHAIQVDDFEIFRFLLEECGADPNVGSRNPGNTGKLMQKNEGNMPLMIAAWDNRTRFVKTLCQDPRTSLNQQDANGFTALIKACYWGWDSCRDILIAAGADQKIVDRDGYTAADHLKLCRECGRKKARSEKNTAARHPVDKTNTHAGRSGTKKGVNHYDDR